MNNLFNDIIFYVLLYKKIIFILIISKNNSIIKFKMISYLYGIYRLFFDMEIIIYFYNHFFD